MSLNSLSTPLLKEQFIPDHVFLYIAKGGVRFFDGSKTCTLRAGEYAIIRKNHLSKFEPVSDSAEVAPYVFCFDEPFLREFFSKYRPGVVACKIEDAVVKLKKTALMKDFIRSLKPYHRGFMSLVSDFEDLKYEELLLILLKSQPELSGMLFDFGVPEKIDLEAFMNRNFQFNVSLKRFAFLTGRSLSAFKRDFRLVFHDTPGRWLVKRRLQEAYFLLDRKRQKPSDIYLPLGFESLSHFSVSFKKKFGLTPTELSSRSVQRS